MLTIMINQSGKGMQISLWSLPQSIWNMLLLLPREILVLITSKVDDWNSLWSLSASCRLLRRLIQSLETCGNGLSSAQVTDVILPPQTRLRQEIYLFPHSPNREEGEPFDASQPWLISPFHCPRLKTLSFPATGKAVTLGASIRQLPVLLFQLGRYQAL